MRFMCLARYVLKGACTSRMVAFLISLLFHLHSNRLVFRRVESNQFWYWFVFCRHGRCKYRLAQDLCGVLERGLITRSDCCFWFFWCTRFLGVTQGCVCAITSWTLTRGGQPRGGSASLECWLEVDAAWDSVFGDIERQTQDGTWCNSNAYRFPTYARHELWKVMAVYHEADSNGLHTVQDMADTAHDTVHTEAHHQGTPNIRNRSYPPLPQSTGTQRNH